jgi:hypothetical protein
MILLSLWLACMLIQLMICKMDFYFQKDLAIAPLICLLIFVLLLINPLHVFYRTARWELFRCLFHILISPFGTVKFKQFFLADIITSMTKPLQDVSYISYWNAYIVFLPYHFRFWQCIRRYKDTKLKI